MVRFKINLFPLSRANSKIWQGDTTEIRGSLLSMHLTVLVLTIPCLRYRSHGRTRAKRAVYPFLSVIPEIIPLRLHQVCRQPCTAIAVIVNRLINKFNYNVEIGAPCGVPRPVTRLLVVRLRHLYPSSSSTEASSHCLLKSND